MAASLKEIKAWVTQDYSDDPREFTVTADPRKLKFMMDEGHIGTEADKFVYSHLPSLREDPIAGEYFHTVFESDPVYIQSRPDSRSFSSMHYMLFGGATDQDFHYHPRAGGVQETSIRYVLVFPFHNLESGKSGVRFDWFDTNHTRIVRDDEGGPDSFPFVEGEPVSPMRTILMPPGQITLVTFPAGIHRFVGEGMAISVHPLDLEHGRSRKGDSFLGNTAGSGIEIVPKDVREIFLDRNAGARSANGLYPISSLFYTAANKFTDVLIQHQNLPGAWDEAIEAGVVENLRRTNGGGKHDKKIIVPAQSAPSGGSPSSALSIPSEYHP